MAQLVINYFESSQSLVPHSKIEQLTALFNSGKDIVFEGAPCIVIVLMDPKTEYGGMGLVDGSIALATAELVAPSLGLGTCWAGLFQHAASIWEPLQKEFGGLKCVGAVFHSKLIVY